MAGKAGRRNVDASARIQDVHLKGDGRKKWLKQWLEYSGHSGCDDDHALMKQRRRPNRACLSHHLATQYYGEEDGADAESKKTYVLYANELPEAGHAPPPPPDLSESSLRLAPKIRGIEGSLPSSLPLFPFYLPFLLIITSLSSRAVCVYIHVHIRCPQAESWRSIIIGRAGADIVWRPLWVGLRA